MPSMTATAYRISSGRALAVNTSVSVVEVIDYVIRFLRAQVANKDPQRPKQTVIGKLSYTSALSSESSSSLRRLRALRMVAMVGRNGKGTVWAASI